MLTVLDLFSGIGGFSLGLEKTGGFKTVAFCEIDPFCRKVLKKHWPEVPIFEDVRTLTHEQVGAVDVICGGFPCQDISVASKGAGIEGERSGLWKEFARIIGEIRPRYVIVENVAALLGRGLGRVLGDLAEIGYDAEWHCIPASAVGAPHRRDRIWIVAYSQCGGSSHERERIASSLGEKSRTEKETKYQSSICVAPCNANVANAESERCEKTREHSQRQKKRFAKRSSVSDADKQGLSFLNGAGNGRSPSRGIITGSEFERILAENRTQQWIIEPDVGRVANGIPSRAHRLRGLGNAVVPQIPEIIGRAILKSMEVL